MKNTPCVKSANLKTEKTALAVFSDFSISAWGSVAWRFLRDMGGTGSPTLCPGLVDSQLGACPGAHSPYNEGLVRKVRERW